MPLSVALIGRLLKAFPGTLKGVKDSSGNYEKLAGPMWEFRP